MYYQQRITNSVQRPSVGYQIHSPIMGQRRDQMLISPTLNYQYPQNTVPKQIYHQEEDEDSHRGSEFQKQQLDSLFLNLKKENQNLKDKLENVNQLIQTAQLKLEKLRKQS